MQLQPPHVFLLPLKPKHWVGCPSRQCAEQSNLDCRVLLAVTGYSSARSHWIQSSARSHSQSLLLSVVLEEDEEVRAHGEGLAGQGPTILCYNTITTLYYIILCYTILAILYRTI